MTVRLERVGPVLIGTMMGLGRASLMSRDHVNGFKAMLTTSEKDLTVKAMVLRSDGSDFTLGLRQNPRTAQRGPTPHSLSATKRRSPFWRPPLAAPLILAVHGRCECAGLDLALIADVVVSGRSTSFLYSSVSPDRADVPIRGYSALKTRTALAPLFAEGRFSSHAAFQHRLVDDVTRDGKEFDRAQDLAFMFAECPPLAICEVLAGYEADSTPHRRPFT